jgi:hypothetical protein
MATKGGKRPGAGRPKGSLNKATADVKQIAGVYSEKAIKTLAAIMDDEGAPAAARVAASNAILDRTYGKPTQSVDASVAASAPLAVTYVAGAAAAPPTEEDYETD